MWPIFKLVSPRHARQRLSSPLVKNHTSFKKKNWNSKVEKVENNVKLTKKGRQPIREIYTSNKNYEKNQVTENTLNSSIDSSSA